MASVSDFESSLPSTIGVMLAMVGIYIGIYWISPAPRSGLTVRSVYRVDSSGPESPLPAEAPGAPIEHGQSPADDLRKALAPTAAQVAEVDRARVDGEHALDEALSALGRRADALDEDWKRFRTICYSTPVRGTFEREWFALLLPSAMPGAVAQSCGKLVVDLKRDANTFSDQVLAAETSARRAGVYSDFIRETLKKYRIDYDTWRP